MLSANVEIVDVDPEHWLNLARLASGRLLPRSSKAAAREKPATLRLLVEGDRCLKAGHSQKGRLPDFSSPWLADPEALGKEQGAAKVTIVERGASRRIMHRVQSQLSLDMNFLEQLLVIQGAVREEMGQGLKIHPRPKIPELKYSAVTTIMKAVLAAGELLVAVIYSDDGKIKDSSGLPIVMSIILRMNDKAEIELLTTTDSLITSGLSVSDWRRDFQRVNDLAQQVWKSKVFLGLHIPLSALPALIRAGMKNEGPNALRAMNKSGELIIDPFPMRVRALLKMGGMLKRR